MMEEKKGKGNQVLLAVVGIATLLVAVIGATFAYFTAAGVTNNAEEDNVVANTATYGDTEVVYLTDNEDITTGQVNLLEADKDQDMTWQMRFKVQTTSTLAQNITINWDSVSNTFARRTNVAGTEVTTGTCNVGEPAYTSEATCVQNAGVWEPDAAATVDVSQDVTYALFECDATGYGDAGWDATTLNGTYYTPTAAPNGFAVPTGCTEISVATPGTDPDPAIPLHGSTAKIQNTNYLVLPAKTAEEEYATNYYALTVTFHNLDKNQNYNQAKSFDATVKVALYTGV